MWRQGSSLLSHKVPVNHYVRTSWRAETTLVKGLCSVSRALGQADVLHPPVARVILPPDARPDAPHEETVKGCFVKPRFGLSHVHAVEAVTGAGPVPGQRGLGGHGD